MPIVQGCPGDIKFTQVKAARHSASACVNEPASVAGEVAPACPAESKFIGIPTRTCSAMQRVDSSANLNGGTTNVLLAIQKGRFRNSSESGFPVRAILNILDMS